MRIAAAAAALCIGTAPVASAAALPTAQQVYTRALDRMLNLPQPKSLSYRVNLTASGARFYVARDADGTAEFGFSIDPGITTTNASWDVSKDADGTLTTIALDDGSQAYSEYPFFNATWAGAYVWLRYGLDGPPEASASASPLPSPSPMPSASEPPIVAFVHAVSEPFYRVVDRGGATCANGDPAVHVGLTARDDPDTHPLTDATIDTRTLDVCSLRYTLRYTQLLGVTGSVALEFESLGGYQIVANEAFDFRFRIRGVGKRRVRIQVRYDDFAFNAISPSPAASGAYVVR